MLFRDESAMIETHVSDLPFVATASDGRILSYWHVTPRGDWCEDCRIGREYADLFVEFMRDGDRPFLLQRVMEDLVRSGKKSGVEVGFLHWMSVLAIRGSLAA